MGPSKSKSVSLSKSNCFILDTDPDFDSDFEKDIIRAKLMTLSNRSILKIERRGPDEY